MKSAVSPYVAGNGSTAAAPSYCSYFSLFDDSWRILALDTAWDDGLFQSPLHALACAGVEFGPDNGVEQDRRTPALLRRTGDQVIQIRRGLGEPSWRR